MNENQKYICDVKVEEIPWNRLTTAYVRATEFPEYFTVIESMSNKKKVKTTLHDILRNIEHQSTLCRATPFTMIFLVRIFQKAVAEMDNNDIAYDIVKELLHFFKLIAELFQETEEYMEKMEMKKEKPLPYFSDMLKEEYLFPEECDNEEDEETLWEEDVEKFNEQSEYSFYYSIYYYSYQVLLNCNETLKKISNTAIAEQVNKLQKLLY